MTWAILQPLLPTVAGGLIGFLVAHRMADRNVRLAAAGKLRAAFVPELAVMRHTPSDPINTPLNLILGQQREQDADVLLEQACKERHAPAMEEYRPLVPTAQQGAYDAACCAYQQHNFGAYARDHPLYCRRVDSVLRFATPHVSLVRIRQLSW